MIYCYFMPFSGMYRELKVAVKRIEKGLFTGSEKIKAISHEHENLVRYLCFEFVSF